VAGVHSVIAEERGAGVLLRVQSNADSDVQSAVLAALASSRLGRVESRAPSLEDAYVAIVSQHQKAMATALHLWHGSWASACSCTSSNSVETG
jgi:invasion protein IalB